MKEKFLKPEKNKQQSNVDKKIEIKRPEKVIDLKESNQFLAEILYLEGVDIYKADKKELNKIRPQMQEIKKRVDGILQERFNISLNEINTLNSGELEEVRKTFLQHFKGTVEKSIDQPLKKQLPLNQLVGYMEVLVAGAYLELNKKIDEDLKQVLGNYDEYLRMKIVNAFKKRNQGRTEQEIDDEVRTYLESSDISSGQIDLAEWQAIFNKINEPLQEEYAKYAEFMSVNEPIRDLQSRTEKKSDLLKQLVTQKTFSWKPAQLEHDIQAQSQEVNRSIIELASNAIDANSQDNNKVDIKIHENGYSVRDNGAGMNPYVILEKLIIPKISGKTGKETIGRFGIGFYTVLSHLKNENDLVRISTNDGKEGYVIEFRIHPRTGDVFVHTEKNDDLEQGTNIEVQAEDFDSADAENLCKDLLKYNDRSNLIVNDEKINDLEEYSSVDGETTSLKYSRELGENSTVSLLVNGVSIEKINVKGANMPAELILDFPLECTLPESRSQLAMDEVAIKSVQEMVDNILGNQISENDKIAVLNAISPSIKKLQERVTSNKRTDNLTKYLQNTFEKEFDRENKVFLPNLPQFQALNIENAIYLDADILESNLENIPGIDKCERFESSEGYTLYITDFKDETEDFIIEHNKILIINRKIYEQHKNEPAILNVYLSNLDHTNTSKKEVNKGRFLYQGQERITTPKEIITEKNENEIKFSKKIANIVYGGGYGVGMTKEEYHDFINSSDKEQIKRIKESVRNGFKNHIEDDISQFLKRVDKILETEPIDKWHDMIINTSPQNVLKGLGENNLLFNYKTLQILKKEKIIQEILEKEDDLELGKNEGLLYSLLKLNNKHSLSKLQKEFEEYENEVFYNCLRFINNLNSSLYGFSLKDDEKSNLESRAIFLIANSISKLPIAEQKEITENLCKKEPMKLYCPIGLAIDKQYHLIPRAIRGYAMYIVEGGEILDEKGYEDARIDAESYDGAIPLSKMVQAKRDNEKYFTNFNEEPAQLIEQCNASQIGIDSSKAMRDIFHSTESQIVNDGYLWIREILQNSVDAVQKERKGYKEAPQVKVDSYLRKNPIEITNSQILKILEEGVKKQYPDHWHIFENYIIEQLGYDTDKLTPENFQDILDSFSVLQGSNKENFFSSSKIQELKDEFKNKSTKEPDLVVEVKDPVGMNLNEVVNYLLIPAETSKYGDEETIGKFGQGFFTVFIDAKEVHIKTSQGDGRVSLAKITPIKDKDNAILDFKIEISESEEDFKGTTIQKIVDTDMPEVEAAFVKSSVVSYGGLLDANAINLNFRDTAVNAPRDVLAEQNIPDLGRMKIYSANENAMTQNGLFIKELDEELLDTIPENIKKIFGKLGIVVDIPPKVKLIKSRNDIARKQEVLPQLQEAMPILALRGYLQSFSQGQVNLDNLPYDYFYADNVNFGRLEVSSQIEEDAQKITQGEALESYEEYLKDENKLIQLLTVVPFIGVDNEKLSLQQLAIKFAQNPESVDIENLPANIQKKLKKSQDKNKEQKQNLELAKKEYESTSTMVKNDFSLPENTELMKKASVYYAYDHLFKEILKAMDSGDVETKYYLQVGESVAHAPQDGNSIGFNLDYLSTKLLTLADSIRDKTPVESQEIQNFIKEIASTITHERQHNKEKSADWTHNDEFFKGQRRVIANLIQNDSLKLKRIFGHIYDNFTDAYVEPKEFIKEV